jgi:SAM-dependent methyltransferase
VETIAAGQVTRSAAEVYDAYFVPALFQQWAYQVANAAEVRPSARVVDIACGTGVLALALAECVGNDSLVTGVDPNEGMLEVARRKAPGIDWRLARAEDLPFADDAFDAVVSQFGLMFFEDKVAGLREMLRVLRPGGRLAVAVWDRLEHSPGYAALVGLLDRLGGPRLGDGLRVPFTLGDVATLRTLFAAAGSEEPSIVTHEGVARFRSIRSWMHTNVKGWTLATQMDPGHYAGLMEEADRELAAFAGPGGSVAFRIPAHVAVVRKPPAE